MTDLRKAAELALDALEILSKNELPKKGAAKAELDEVVIPILRQALEQSEQEPLAWLVLTKDNNAVSLYAAPPSREWVGLTDEEIKSICDEWKIMYGGYLDGFAKFTESKLKEKNT
jgi:hypothetical protein